MARSLGQLIAGAGVAQQTWDDQARQESEDAFRKTARDLAIEEAKANNAILPSRNAARIARHGVITDESNARRRVIPQETENKIKAQGLEGRDLDEQGKTFDDRAATARNNIQAARKQSEVALATAGFGLEELPVKLKAARTQLAWDEAKAGKYALAGIEMAMSTGRGQVVKDYVNRALENGLAEGFEGEKVKEIGMGEQPGPDGNPIPLLVITMESGRQLALDRRAIKREFDAMDPGELKVLNQGDKLVSIPKSGGPARVVAEGAGKWKIENGIAINEATGERVTVKGARSTEQLNQDIRRGREQLDTVYGIKRDALGNMLNPDVVQDADAWLRDDAELQKRIIAGDDPVQAGSEIGRRAIAGKRAEDVAPAGKSPIADQILKDHGWGD